MARKPKKKPVVPVMKTYDNLTYGQSSAHVLYDEVPDYPESTTSTPGMIAGQFYVNWPPQNTTHSHLSGIKTTSASNTLNYTTTTSDYTYTYQPLKYIETYADAVWKTKSYPVSGFYDRISSRRYILDTCRKCTEQGLHSEALRILSLYSDKYKELEGYGGATAYNELKIAMEEILKDSEYIDTDLKD